MFIHCNKFRTCFHSFGCYPNIIFWNSYQYWEILDVRLNQAMIGQLSSQEALDLVAQEWEGVTDDLGRDDQIAIYQAGIGYNP